MFRNGSLLLGFRCHLAFRPVALTRFASSTLCTEIRNTEPTHRPMARRQWNQCQNHLQLTRCVFRIEGEPTVQGSGKATSLLRIQSRLSPAIGSAAPAPLHLHRQQAGCLPPVFAHEQINLPVTAAPTLMQQDPTMGLQQMQCPCLCPEARRCGAQPCLHAVRRDLI